MVCCRTPAGCRWEWLLLVSVHFVTCSAELQLDVHVALPYIRQATLSSTQSCRDWAKFDTGVGACIVERIFVMASQLHVLWC